MQSFITGSFLTPGGLKPGDEGYRISRPSGGGVALASRVLSGAPERIAGRGAADIVGL